MKDKLKERFTSAYPNKRLLAIQLNGFSHKVFYDEGKKTSKVQCDEYSGCAPEIAFPNGAQELFRDIGHSYYQNNAKEYVYIDPNDR